MIMTIEDIQNYIISGEIFGLSLTPRIGRMDLLNDFGHLEGINKKNGVYEILKYQNLIFYVGFGTRGSLEGIKMTNLDDLKITMEEIEKILEANKINFQMTSNVIHCQTGNELILNFSPDGNGNYYLDNLINVEDKVLLDKLISF